MKGNGVIIRPVCLFPFSRAVWCGVRDGRGGRFVRPLRPLRASSFRAFSCVFGVLLGVRCICGVCFGRMFDNVLKTRALGRARELLGSIAYSENFVNFFKRRIMFYKVIDYFMGVFASIGAILLATISWWLYCAWQCTEGIYPGILWVNFNNTVLRLIF